MDHEAMVRYLAGELRIPAADLDRTLAARLDAALGPEDAG